MSTGATFTGVEPRVSTWTAPRGLKPAARTAFTLLEVVIVLVIMGIISAIAVPRYANALARHRLDAAATRIVADLSLARQQAKTSGTTQTVRFNLVKNVYELDGVQHLDHAGRNYEVLLSQEPYRTEIVSADLGGDAEIIFDSYGVPDSGGTVVLQAGKYQKTVAVEAGSGRASVQ
jgi:type II secretion system protein H